MKEAQAWIEAHRKFWNDKLDALAEEISQLLYWTQVLMISRGLCLDDVYQKL